MKKRIKILTLALLLTTAAQAQIFLEDGSTNNRSSYENETGDIGVMPYHQVEHDQSNYVPAGSGITLLFALGVAYWAKKRRINRNNRQTHYEGF